MSDKLRAALLVNLTTGFLETDVTKMGPIVAKILLQEIAPRLEREGTPIEQIEEYHYGFTDLIRCCAHNLYFETMEYRHVRQAIDDCWYKYTGFDLSQYLVASKLLDEAGDDELLIAIDQALANNPKIVTQYKAGKDKVIGSLIGPILKQCKANPSQITELIKQRIASL